MARGSWRADLDRGPALVRTVRPKEGPLPTQIRLACPGDISALSDLARATFCETFVDKFKIGYSLDDLTQFLETSYAPAAVLAWLNDENGRLLGAEAEGRLLAYVQAGDNGLPYPEAAPDAGEIKRLYVASRAQGQGLGRALLERSLAWLDRRPIYIGVWRHNHPALALYRRYGFEAVGAYRFRVGASLDDELILGRPAGPAQARDLHP